jgi:hypothetical protein
MVTDKGQDSHLPIATRMSKGTDYLDRYGEINPLNVCFVIDKEMFAKMSGWQEKEKNQFKTYIFERSTLTPFFMMISFSPDMVMSNNSSGFGGGPSIFLPFSSNHPL